MKKINGKLILLLILSLLVHQHQVHGFFTLALSLVQFAWTAFGVANELHDTYDKISTPSTADLMEKSEEIAQSLDKWGGRIEEKIDQSVDLLLRRLPLLGQINDDVQLLNSYVGRIGSLYRDYEDYLADPEHFDEKELLSLITVFTSLSKGDVQDTISSMFNLIIPSGLGKLKKSLLVLIAQESKNTSSDLCDTSGSPQQRLMQFYDVIIETEMRAYTMTIFGYTMEGFMEKTNRSNALGRVRDKLLERAQDYLRVLKYTVGSTPTVFRQCDPPLGYERGVTYYEFEKFMTGYPASESVFGKHGRCINGCYRYSEPSDQFRGRCVGLGCSWNDHACAGKLAECSGMAGTITYCRNDGSEGRRFQWFKDEQTTYGDETRGCPADVQREEKERNMFNQWCGSCRCVCVEGYPESRASHFISLRDQMTDVKDNMVATGIRFMMHNKILYPQVMQGRLGANADIPRNTTSWVELEDYHYNTELSVQLTEKSYFSRTFFKFIKKTADGEDQEAEDGDVFTLTYEERRINLDFLVVPKDHVVTGVRFQNVSTGNMSGLQLEIHATSYNKETGELDLDSGRWIKPDDMPYAQQENATRVDYGEIEGKRNPAESTETKIDTLPYTFMNISYSSMEYDAGQTTIPLLDAMAVTTNPPIPIIGVGLLHKKQAGYGGFLTFVLQGADIVDLVPKDI